MRGYILTRVGHPTLFLSPLLDITAAARWNADEQLQWYCAGSPTSALRDEAAKSAYAQIDTAVNRWISDKRYIPRLLVAAVVFLGVYFIGSLVVRDPIPIIDELLIASAISVVAWIFMARRERTAGLAMKRRMELKDGLGNGRVESMGALDGFESYLAQMQELPLFDLCEMLAFCSSTPLAQLHVAPGSLASEVLEYLRLALRYGHRREWRMFSQVMQCRKGGKPSERLAAQMLHQGTSGRLDVPLLAFCVALSELPVAQLN